MIYCPNQDLKRDIRSNIPLCFKEFPPASPLGTPSGKGVYLTVYPSSCPNTETVWSLHILNILGTEIWKPLLKEIIKLQLIPFVMVTTNLQEKIMKLQFLLVVLVTPYATEHNRSRHIETTLKGKNQTLVYSSFIGYYI